MIEQRIQEARELHVRGDLNGAIAAYGEVLAGNPELPEVWHLKGMAEHQSGRLDDARASAARAIASGGERPAFLLLEGGVLHDGGDLEAARDRFARVAAAKPEWAFGHLELGRVQMDQGNAAAAAESFRAAVNADPKHVRGWNNLGIALLTLDRLDDAQRAFNHTISLDPDYGLAHYNLARIYNRRGDARRALAEAQAALRANENHAEAWLLVGDLHRRARESEAALTAYAMAIRIAPGNLDARNAMAVMLSEAGHYDDAKREFRRIAEASPGNLKAALGANLLLPQGYSSVENLEMVRREYGDALERLHNGAGRFRFDSPERALIDASWTNFYLAYQGHDDLALQKRYGELHRRILEPVVPELFRPRPRRTGGGRIRVGFASHFFFNCTAGRYFSSWITHLDRARFEVYVYYTNEWVADDTRTIAAAAHAFRHVAGKSVHGIATQIAADDLDILVYPELGMHAETFTLAGLRLAPVQAAGWGHPNTTGLPEIDWFISCADMEPEDGAAHYSERLALLPGLGTRYAMPRADPAGTRADFGVPEDRTVYLVPQSLFKIHPDNDELIARVLERDPRGVALMFASHQDNVTQQFAQRLQGSLVKRGLDIHERVVFLVPSLAHGKYLRLNQLCDVMLDTLHWSGGNTSLDALANGLPVVTLPGALMRGRQSRAMLRTLGVDELVASDAQSFVDIAVRIGTDRDARVEVSQRILANRGALFERDEPVRELGDFLEKAARG
jgi:predicted O-linked N-acetylglucosamine transferase (SPINDLY family)